MFAKVVVDVRSSNVDVMYTYIIPDKFRDYIDVGSRVLIDFNLRKILGYVVEITDKSDYDGRLKEILDVLDFQKELTKEQVDLAKHISLETKSLLVSALELMYPSFLKSKYRKYISVINYDLLDADIALLFTGKSKILINDDIISLLPKIKKEIDKGNLELSYDIYTYGKGKRIKLYYLNPRNKFDLNTLTPKRKRIYDFLSQNPQVNINDICNAVGCSDVLVKELEKSNIIKSKEVEILDNNKSTIINKPKVEYSFMQREVKEKYDKLINKPFIFFSNDNKFIINFYLDIISENVLNKKKVMVVTPSILSNTEIYNYLKTELLNSRIYDFSSSLTNANYYSNYVNVKWDNFDIIVTTKVGIFLPINNLGLIIMVDEGNLNYINEQSPKFNTKKVLEYRANYHKSKLVLQSIAPSVESFYNYFLNKYYLLNYNIKYNNQIRLVNMRDEFGSSNLIVSKVLEEEIYNSLKQNKIAMLILNTKGYSTSLVCKECSNVMKCPKCRIPLSYSKDKDVAHCSYCDYKSNIFKCDKCGSHSISNYGYGLEKLEEVLLNKFKDIKILKVDSDSLTNKEQYTNALISIEDNEVDIILGTNVLHDLVKDENIGLIATINADNILNSSDFRNSEILYNQISSSVNRKNVTVVIQGYNLNHYSINYALNNNYDEFFNKEIEYRKSLNYSPILETSRIIITGPFKEMYHCANYFKKVFNKVISGEKDALGPVYLKRYRGVQVILKYSDFEKVSKLIDEVANKFNEEKVLISFERYPRSFS